MEGKQGRGEKHKEDSCKGVIVFPRIPRFKRMFESPKMVKKYGTNREKRMMIN